MEFLLEYGMFLAKSVTLVLAVLVALGGAVALLTQGRGAPESKGRLEIRYVNADYADMELALHSVILPKKALKALAKQRKAQAKQREGTARPRLFVLNFHGDMRAAAVSALREEVTAVLQAAQAEDRVLLRLESAGGVVHGYGLAAAQLLRIKERQLHLTVAVDKVAASGGYMMACVADKIVAAPFSIIGSIGVVAQIPNFNRFLKNKEIDIELHTAGQYKRTLTLLGENTEEGRQKFREDLNETHHLFKDFVHRMRPTLDIEQVATGEHWYGIQAQEKGLVDEVGTSDDLLLNLMEGRELVGVRFTQRKRLLDRFTNSAAESADRLLLRWLQRGQKPLL